MAHLVMPRVLSRLNIDVAKLARIVHKDRREDTPIIQIKVFKTGNPNLAICQLLG